MKMQNIKTTSYTQMLKFNQQGTKIKLK